MGSQLEQKTKGECSMTTTDPDYRALLRNVLESPNDDLPRLVLCDWLEEPERAGSVPCESCKGQVLATNLDTEEVCAWCLTCNGTGYVSNGNEERAEFIRLQCEIAQNDAPTLSERVRALFTTVFRENKWVFGSGNISYCLPDTTFSRQISDDRTGIIAIVSRGFVGSIRLIEEQFEQHAAELFREHPITKVVLSGKEPRESMYSGGRYLWNYRDDASSDVVPYVLLAEMYDSKGPDDIDGRTWIVFNSRELALVALSRACVRYGRRLAGLPEEYAQ